MKPVNLEPVDPVDDTARKILGETIGEGEPTGSPDPPVKKRGRPKGSKNKSASEAIAPPPEFLRAAWSMIAKFGWQFSVHQMGNRPLSDEESSALGEAMSIVADKYLPQVAEYTPELNLLLVVSGLYIATLPIKVEPHADPIISSPIGAQEYNSSGTWEEGLGEIHHGTPNLRGAIARRST